jgi:hypothetical protein
MSADVLPQVIVIGAMKCATSAVHEYLDAHPDISMSSTKELNFFNGPEMPPHDDEHRWWITGQWHRGVDWYQEQFDPRASVRGESSPAYTSPDHPDVPARMATVVPRVRLVYLVRDPVERAVSQWSHHRRDGSEERPVEEALLDPESQYLARSRYHERVAHFLSRFQADQLLVVVQERLLRRRNRELARIYQHVGVEMHRPEERHTRQIRVGSERPGADPGLRSRFMERVGDDVAQLRALVGDDLEEWRSA